MKISDRIACPHTVIPTGYVLKSDASPFSKPLSLQYKVHIRHIIDHYHI